MLYCRLYTIYNLHHLVPSGTWMIVHRVRMDTEDMGVQYSMGIGIIYNPLSGMYSSSK